MSAPLRTLLVAAMLAFGGAPAWAEPKVHEVVIEGMQFSPASLQVNQGDTVRWTNKDMFPHNATASDGSFGSGDLAPGQSWSYRAERKGSFAYLCTLHPTMKASLTVK